MAHFADPEVMRRKADVPGPGIYGNGLEMNSTGVYVLSTVENSRATKWSPSKQRFPDPDYYRKQSPGPGEYQPSDYNYSTGMYITSQFKNRGSIQYKRDITRKADKTRHETPGPGSYIAPSDFGHFELKPQDAMGEFLNTKIGNDITPRRTGRINDVTPRSQTSQGMRSNNFNS